MLLLHQGNIEDFRAEQARLDRRTWRARMLLLHQGNAEAFRAEQAMLDSGTERGNKKNHALFTRAMLLL